MTSGIITCLLALTAATAAHAESRMGVGSPYSVEVSASGKPPVRLHAEEAGAGPPLLLLHGLGASTFTWRRIAPDLARDHHVIALDLLGFGQSDKPSDAEYTAEAEAALVVAFIEKRGLRGLTLVGHSFGGSVALFVASALKEQPGRVERLVLIDASSMPQVFPDFAGVLETPVVADALVGATLPPLIARSFLNVARAEDNPPPEDDITGYAEPFYDRGARAIFLETARGIIGRNARGYGARWRTLDAPALLVWCRADEIVPLSVGRKLARVLPNAQLRTLRGCNHIPQDERPAALVSVMRGWLDR